MPKKKTNRNSQEHWEKVLKSHGLGTSLALTDNSDEKVVDAPTFKAPFGGDDFEKLRQQFDGSEGFMEGHQIQKTRESSSGGFGRDDKDIPAWVFDDSKVRLLLLTVFPKLGSDQRQRARAARWLRVIYLYYRMKLPRNTVAKELGITYTALESLSRSINRAFKGERANGSGKKTSVPSPEPTCEGTGRKENAANQGV